jgi:5'(3')-deoxyribonucleotidase
VRLVKPTLNLDVDGILADFVSAALAIVHDVTGHRYTANDVTTWEVFDSIPEKDVQADVYAVMKARGGCLSIPVYQGAQEGVRRLQSYVDIACVTSPFRGSPTWAHEREVWLEKLFGISHVIHAHRKERVHADFFVDDKPTHVDEWLRYWFDTGRDVQVEGICWKTPRMVAGPLHPYARVVESWDDLVNIVATRTASLGAR